jgi:flagellar FliJ protein
METVAAMKREQAGGVSSDQVVAYHAYLQRLSNCITRQMKVVGEVKERESRKVDELLEAMKKRRILDKLKEKDLDRYHQRMLKKEMNFVDEIAVNQFARRTMENSGGGQ